MKTAPLLALGLMLVAGCTDPTQAPPTSLAPECPEPETRTIPVTYRAHNVSYLGGYTRGNPYAEFSWAAPENTPLVVDVRAEWDAGTLGEKTLQLRLTEKGEAFEPLASARGTSPLTLQFNATAREKSLLVHVENSPETVAETGAGASLVEMEVLLTVTQILPCPA